MFIVDRFSLVSIEPYKNQCLDKHMLCSQFVNKQAYFLLTLDYNELVVFLILFFSFYL